MIMNRKLAGIPRIYRAGSELFTEVSNVLPVKQARNLPSRNAVALFQHSKLLVSRTADDDDVHHKLR
jgi:hypothetical protein